MMKVNAKEKFNTSFGTAFVVDKPPKLKVGDVVNVNGKSYRIKRIILPSRPTDTENIVIYVD